MSQVTFTGSVSHQEKVQTVTITVMLPDNTTETLTTTTLADKTFSTSKQYPPGNYSAFAHVDENGLYLAADSPTVPFTVGKLARTITLNVNVA